VHYPSAKPTSHQSNNENFDELEEGSWTVCDLMCDMAVEMWLALEDGSTVMHAGIRVGQVWRLWGALAVKRFALFCWMTTTA
jgi:hypothetical protein